jgi:type IV conjugative transfer system coupling protein TraD
MSDFVRGGQITFHSLRMVVQLMKPLSRWGLIIWLALTIALVSMKLEKHHYDYSISYMKAKFYNGIGLGAQPLSVGRSKSTASNIVSNPVVYRYYSKTIDIVKGKSLIAILMAGFVYFAILLYFIAKGSKWKKSDFIRGRELISANELKKLITKNNKHLKYKAYTVAGISYPHLGETHHTMIAGATGTGKTVLISELVTQIMDKGDKAVIYDMTGTFTEKFYRPGIDTVLNPFDERSRGWSLLEEADHEIEFDTIAEALIGQDIGMKDDFWPTGARTIISELCKKFYRENHLSTKALMDALLNIDIKGLNSLLKGTVAEKLVTVKNMETTSSLLSTLITYVKCLQYLKETENNFSIRKWIRDRDDKSCVFLTSKSIYHSSLVPIISVIMDIAITGVMDLSKDLHRKTWFIFDELASLNSLPSLERGLTITRNYGGCFVIGIQAISQLFSKYGRDTANTLSANCNNKIILRSPDSETARWCSDIIGTQEVEIFREGMSYGAHEVKDGVNIARHFSERRVALPAEIMSLKDREGFILMTGGHPIAKIAFPYKSPPTVNEAFVPIKMPKNSDISED